MTLTDSDILAIKSGGRSTSGHPPVGGGVNPTRPLQFFEYQPLQFFEVRELSHSIASPFIIEHHYSHTTPRTDNIFFGCYIDGVLFAVVNYGRLASRTSPAVVLKLDEATAKNTLELRRLCRLGKQGEPGPVMLSDVLKVCHDILRERGYRYIVSYSDRKHNQFKIQFRQAAHKSGGIYKFSGFTYLGETAETYHYIDELGEDVHRSRPYRKMLAHNTALCKKLGFEIERSVKGTRTDRVWPTDRSLWATDDTLPEDKLWTKSQVAKAMKLTVVVNPPKDKWLLTL